MSEPKPRACLSQRLEEGVAAPCTQSSVVSAVAAVGAESEYCKGVKACRAKPGQMAARAPCGPVCPSLLLAGILGQAERASLARLSGFVDRNQKMY